MSNVRVNSVIAKGTNTVTPAQTNATTNILNPERDLKFFCRKKGAEYRNVNTLKIAVIHNTLRGRLKMQKITIPKERNEKICMVLREWARLR